MSTAKLKAAIEDRDATIVIDVFFDKKPLRLKDGMKREEELWDYKEICPKPQPSVI